MSEIKIKEIYLKKQNLLEWRVWFKIILGFIVIATLIWDLTDSLVELAKITPANFTNTSETYSAYIIYDQHGKFVGVNYWEYLINFFSMFTIQSNILVFLWLVISTIKHNYVDNLKVKSLFLSRMTTISIGCYIGLTCVVWNAVLLPQSYATFSISDWITGLTLHLLVPLMFVIFISVINLSNTFIISNKTYYSKFSYKILLYPLIYMVYGLVKGEIMYISYSGYNLPYDVTNNYQNSAFQYFFFNLNEVANLVWLIGILVVGVGFVICLGMLINIAINKTVNNNNNNNLLTK